MRKLPFLMLASLYIILSIGCGENRPASVNAVASPTVNTSTPVYPRDGNYDARGTITKINNELGSIEFDHEEIPGLMPAMRMEFFVKDKAILNGLAVGDNVDFVIEYKHPAETVVSVKKIK
jgi:Cu/Ag efflux protein CusF